MRKFIIVLLLAALLCCGCSERKLKTSEKAESGKAAESVSSQAEPSSSAPSSSAESSQKSLSKLAAPYAEILKSGKYYIDCTAVINAQGMILSNPMLIAADGENSSISVSSDLSGTMVTMRTLRFDGVTYMVNDSKRTYMKVDEQQSGSSFNTDFADLEYTDESSGEIDGEMLPCVRYDCGGDTVCLFFKNDLPAGLTRTIKDEMVSEMALKINGLSQNIPDRLIAMPLGYTEQQTP